MISIPLSPDKFASIKKNLESNEAVLTKTAFDDNDGTFSTDQVSLSYHYNGTDTLAINILAKHGLARFAGEDTIKSHIQTLLETV
jgi:hypothetical protein